MLNRPEVRNAFNEDLIAEVTSWAQRAATDSGLRAVVISGAGPAFCAGADIAWMAKMASYTREDNLRDARAAAAMFEAVNTLPMPVIARIHGAALGGGTGLAAVADIALADEGCHVWVHGSEAGAHARDHRSLRPRKDRSVGGARVVSHRTPIQSARSRCEIGLVHAVVAANQLDRAVGQYLDDLLANGREAMAAAKMLLRQIAHRSITDATPLNDRGDCRGAGCRGKRSSGCARS